MITSHSRIVPIFALSVAFLLLLVLPCLVTASGGRCSSTDCYHQKPHHSSDDGWATDQADSLGMLLSKRAHPPHEASVLMDKFKFCSLITPTHTESRISPIWWMIASLIFFSILYKFSQALHQYASEDAVAQIAMHRKEQEMQHNLQAAAANGHNGDVANENGSNGIARRHVARPSSIQVIPAILADRSPRGLFSAYVRAYAVATTGDPTNCIEWNSRLVSNVHALISIVLGFACFFASTSTVDEALINPNAQPTEWTFASSRPLYNPLSSRFTPSLLAFNEDALRDIALMITCGYLLYDFLLCLWVRWTFRFETKSGPSGQRVPIRIDDGLTLVHHILIIFAFAYGVHTHIGTWFMSCFLLNELSTPCLNWNFFLAALGEEWKGTIYKLNGAILFVIFVIARVVFNIYVLCVMIWTWYSLRIIFLVDEFPYLFSSSAPLSPSMLAKCTLLSSLAVGHVIINLIWFSSLYRAIRRKLCRPSHTSTRPRKQRVE